MLVTQLRRKSDIGKCLALFIQYTFFFQSTKFTTAFIFSSPNETIDSLITFGRLSASMQQLYFELLAE